MLPPSPMQSPGQGPAPRSLSLSKGREVGARGFDKLSDRMVTALSRSPSRGVTIPLLSLLAKLSGTTTADRRAHFGP